MKASVINHSRYAVMTEESTNLPSILILLLSTEKGTQKGKNFQITSLKEINGNCKGQLPVDHFKK